jgi:2-phospho-L-lactate guanylyltransferase
VIPVKPLVRAKSRLADILNAEQRATLADLMYRQVLSVAASVPTLAGVLVISRDPQALAIAREFNVRTIQENTRSDLNPALSRATEMIKVWRAEAILILPADLPFITPGDVTSIIALARKEPCVVIATDRDADGTNAMLVRPPGLFKYEYGARSFDRHIALARAMGADVQVYASDSISLDIDVPHDLMLYNQRVATGAFAPHLLPFLSSTDHA